MSRPRGNAQPTKLLLLLVVFALSTLIARGGEARVVKGTGIPMTWNTAGPVQYNPDRGPLGILTNAQADALLDDAFARWAAVAMADISFAAGAELPLDVNADGVASGNPAHWGNFWQDPGDALSPVIYDEDGFVLDSMFGLGARYDLLGVATLDDDPEAVSPLITGAGIVINGAFYDGVGMPASPEDVVSEEALKAVMVHEVGHFCNLGHSVVNYELTGDGDKDNDIYLPSMFPILSEDDDEEALATLNPDDEAALATLYPAAGFPASTASVSGSVIQDGEYFQGANVIARKVGDPLLHAYSGISGALYFPCNPGGTCPPPPPPPPAAGAFSIKGMAAGDYTICMEQLDTRLNRSNGTFIGPKETPVTILGPEECYDTNESVDPGVDDPDHDLHVALAAGVPATGIDILVNDLPDPVTWVDGFESNDDRLTAAPLPVLDSDGKETVPAVLAADDLDFYEFSVNAGETVTIDIESEELGSASDPVMGVWDPFATLTVIDDAMDPDSGAHRLDPALTFVALSTGTYAVGISAYPDLDISGDSGADAFAYWASFKVETDLDGDGVVDGLDRCPDDPGDDLDDDGHCAGSDNCPGVHNPSQADDDGDGAGDACDNCLVLTAGSWDFESGPEVWTHAQRGGADTWHRASATCTGVSLPSTMWVSNGGAGAGCVPGTSSEWSQLLSPPVWLPPDTPITLSFDVFAIDALGSCVATRQPDSKDVGITTDGGATYTLLNNCTQLVSASGVVTPRSFDISSFAGELIQVIFVYSNWGSAAGVAFAVDNVKITLPNGANDDQADSDGDGQGDSCDPCPGDPLDDPDADNVCNDLDGCPAQYNPDDYVPDRLHDPLVLPTDLPYERPVYMRISPDGSTVVFAATTSIPPVYELYTVPIDDSSPPVKISGPLVSGGSVEQSRDGFVISPDGSTVVFRADKDTDEVWELYSVPLDGSELPVKISGTMTSGGDVLPNTTRPRFVIDPDSAYVAYTANQITFAQDELFCVPIDGSVAPVKLNPTLTADGDVQPGPIFNSDGTRIFYAASREVHDHMLLYANDWPCGPPPAAPLSDPIQPEGGITCENSPRECGFDLTPDDTRVVYAAYSGNPRTSDLWSVPSAGGVPATKLTPPMAPNPGVRPDFAIAPNSSTAYYMADQEVNGLVEIYRVGVTGGTVSKLSGTMNAGGPGTLDFKLSGDGSRLVYRAEQDINNVYELYTVSTFGGPVVRLNGATHSLYSIGYYEISADNETVVYLDDHDGSGDDLFSVPIAGGPAIQLNRHRPYGHWEFRLAPDSSRVVYEAYFNHGWREFLSVPIGGGQIVKVDSGLGAGRGTSLTHAHISADSARVVYDVLDFPTATFEVRSALLPDDTDGDGILQSCDVCPSVTDPVQADADGDGLGDLCDNCPELFNPGQEDTETAAGPDATCDTPDDNGHLYGPDGICGTPDDLVGDGVGDVCDRWSDVTTSPLADGTDPKRGVSWIDFDGDDDLDLFVTHFGFSDVMLRNDGGGTFVDATDDTMAGAGESTGATWGDYDNDGDEDVYVARFSSSNRLFSKNTSGESFTDVTPPVLADTGAGRATAWADCDNDGDLDLYLVNTTSANRLFRNDGAGSFTDITAGPLGGLAGDMGTAVAWADYDGDSDQDLYVANGAVANKLLRNDGDCAFTDVTAGPLGETGGTEGVAWGDYDNDGDMDLFLAGLSSSNKLLRNDGGGVFTDVTASPLADPLHSLGVAWGDFDNDGWLDLYLSTYSGESNRLFRNIDGSGVFEDATSGPLGDTGNGRGVAWGDYDDDGDLDLYLVNSGGSSRLIRNETPHDKHWLQLDLAGVTSNRSAIGARVIASTSDGRTLTREVSGGSGFISQDSLTVEFGLGSQTEVQNLEIRWPSGVVQTLANVAADQRLQIVESGPDEGRPWVGAMFPPAGSMDVPLSTSVVLLMNEPIDEDTANPAAISLSLDNVKVPGRVLVSAGGRLVAFDPHGTLTVDADYVLHLNETGDGLRDPAGNPAIPFSGGFDMTGDPDSGRLLADEVGAGFSGAALYSREAFDSLGFANAIVGDVNGDEIDDILVGAPYANDGAETDTGVATLFLGGDFQSGSSELLGIEFVGEVADDRAGESVAWAGDINEDGLDDFMIGAPHASPSGADSGKVYLVFGHSGLVAPATYHLANLTLCTPPLCGIVFEGAAEGDLAGTSMDYAGDIDGPDVMDESHPDLLIGAPGADVGGALGAGKVYLIYGPLTAADTIGLDTVGTPATDGLVFHGESVGDRAGEAVSRWEEYGDGTIDDLLIGAPGASTMHIVPIPNAGEVYAIWGGTANLDDKAEPGGIIALNRVANGVPGNEIQGVVFLGTEPGAAVGRSVNGTVDLDGDLQPDIAIGGENDAWGASAGGPKTITGVKKLSKESKPDPTTQDRVLPDDDAVADYGAIYFVAGGDGDLGGVTVGGSGDVNNDGIDDLILGAGGVDAGGLMDAGRAYVFFGSEVLPTGEVRLSDIGVTLPGIQIDGAEIGDELGRSVAGGMDVTGDGIGDLVIGAPNADSHPSAPEDGGETYVFSIVPPSEVDNLTVEKGLSSDTLEWSAADRATGYNVYRGTLSSLRARGYVQSSDMLQLACGIQTDADMDGSPDTDDGADPPAGEGFFYLVTPVSSRGEGLLGPLDATPPRVHDSQC